MKSKHILTISFVIICMISCTFAFVSCGKQDDEFVAPEEQLKYSEGLEFSLLDDGTYSVTGYTGTDTDVVIPSKYEGKTVTSIGASAFYNTQITSVIIQDGIINIENWAFGGCKFLTSIEIPNSVTNIETCAFSGWFDSVTYMVYDNLRYYEYDNAYYLGNNKNHYVVLVKVKDTSITSCTINENTKVIYESAFSDCSSLTSIEIPSSVTSIGGSAFSRCSALTSIEIPSSVKNIEGGAFYNCSNLTNVTIGENITSIENGAFEGCSNLVYNEYDNACYLGNSLNPYIALVKAKNTSITSCIINENTKVIGDSAFSGCGGLTSINIPSSVISIGDSAFSECSVLTSITVNNDNSVYHSASNCLIETSTKTLILGCKNSVIPIDNSVTSIESYAFSGCSGLTSVNIPNSVTSIGVGAFFGCKTLTSITIPNSVTRIRWQTFYECSGLTSVVIGSSVTDIESYAFGDCSGLTSIEIPNGVTSIGEYAFRECSNLTSIEIPNSVTNIGSRAFIGCNIINIAFNGTKVQWEEIGKGEFWDYRTGDYTIHCTDGDIHK